MLGALRPDWTAYEERTRAIDAEWARSLTPAARFDLVCDMFNLVRAARDPKVDETRLEALRWQNKLATRRRLIEAFQKLDAWRERTAQCNTP